MENHVIDWQTLDPETGEVHFHGPYVVTAETRERFDRDLMSYAQTGEPDGGIYDCIERDGSRSSFVATFVNAVGT